MKNPLKKNPEYDRHDAYRDDLLMQCRYCEKRIKELKKYKDPNFTALLEERGKLIAYTIALGSFINHFPRISHPKFISDIKLTAEEYHKFAALKDKKYINPLDLK